MSSSKDDLPVGQMTKHFAGNISQLNAIVLSDYRRTEENIGYHKGRLDQGFKLLVLKHLPLPEVFEFQGTTLRSGGRYGLPEETQEADRRRATVHDGILADRGAAGYRDLQTRTLSLATVTGPKRLVKVMPTIRHDEHMAPRDQYPMGGGFLQWDLKKPGLPFFCAAHFKPGGTVVTVDGMFQVNSDNFLADYPQREKLQKYLQTV